MSYMKPKLDAAKGLVFKNTGFDIDSAIPIDDKLYLAFAIALELLGGILFTLNSEIGAVLLVRSGEANLGGKVQQSVGLSLTHHSARVERSSPAASVHDNGVRRRTLWDAAPVCRRCFGWKVRRSHDRLFVAPNDRLGSSPS